jgi:hypothetical protein
VQSIFRHSQKRDVPELLSPAVPRVPAAVVAAPSEMWFQIASGSGCRCKSSPPNRTGENHGVHRERDQEIHCLRTALDAIVLNHRGLKKFTGCFVFRFAGTF